MKNPLETDNFDNVESNITVIRKDNVAILEFSPGHYNNPFSAKRMRILKRIVDDLNQNSKIRTIILYGGKNNSFSVGGDFNETSNFSNSTDVITWIDDVTEVYLSILNSKIPIIACVEGYSIGFGLQLALLCDYRIGATNCKLQMPEFKMGISCNFGGLILEKTVGRSLMQKMLFDCEIIEGKVAEHLGLLHKTHAQDIVFEKTLEFAQKLALYPETVVTETKASINREFISDIEKLNSIAKNSHVKGFAEGIAQKNMKNIITNRQKQSNCKS
ncbi:MAG: enoyl-CoA hydratase/isomerase family protein [Alphaproteobacteria bacterium]